MAPASFWSLPSMLSQTYIFHRNGLRNTIHWYEMTFNSFELQKLTSKNKKKRGTWDFLMKHSKPA